MNKFCNTGGSHCGIFILILPVSIPQSPCIRRSKVTVTKLPWQRRPNNPKQVIMTSAVWSIMTKPWVIIWDTKISVVDTPATSVLSQTPSSLSVIITIEVTVTAKKKINLQKKINGNFFSLTWHLHSNGWKNST